MLLARIVHVLAMAVWVGGTVFLVAVAVPFARSFGPDRRTEIAAAIGRRFRPVAWTALAALVASGVYMMLRLDRLAASHPDRGSLIGKLVLVGAILVLSALHDFVIGPRVERDASSRRTLLVLARTNGVLTLAIPVIGVLLAH
jgi:putative copper resistance protein D